MPWKRLYLVSALAAIAVVVAATPFLPPQIATHFDSQGRADGFGGRWSFAALFGGLILGATILYWGLPALLRNLPISLINLPNREYWLAPERKDQTIESMSVFLYELGFFTNLLIGAIAAVLYHANITATNTKGITKTAAPLPTKCRAH